MGVRRHEIDELDRPIAGLEQCYEDQRAVDITALDPGIGIGRRDQPAAVLGLAEKRRKAGAGIKARPTKPVDRAVARNQRGRGAVSDQRIVLDPLVRWHQLSPKMREPPIISVGLSWTLVCDSRSRFLRGSPADFDVGSDRGQRDGWCHALPSKSLTSNPLLVVAPVGMSAKASISPLSEPSREARKAAGGHDFRLPPPLPSPSSPSWAPAPRH